MCQILKVRSSVSYIACVLSNDITQTLTHTAVAVSFSSMDYNATEAVDMSVEVCVEVVMGTVNQVASVDLQTVSGSATGKDNGLRVMYSSCSDIHN